MVDSAMKIIILHTACTNMLRVPQKPYSSRPHNLLAMPPNPPPGYSAFHTTVLCFCQFYPPSQGLWIGPLGFDTCFRPVAIALRGIQQKWHWWRKYRHWWCITGTACCPGTCTGGAVTALVPQYRHWWLSHRHCWCLTGLSAMEQCPQWSKLFSKACIAFHCTWHLDFFWIWYILWGAGSIPR
jgi:hypothetical protein